MHSRALLLEFVHKTPFLELCPTISWLITATRSRSRVHTSSYSPPSSENSNPIQQFSGLPEPLALVPMFLYLPVLLFGLLGVAVHGSFHAIHLKYNRGCSE